MLDSDIQLCVIRQCEHNLLQDLLTNCKHIPISEPRGKKRKAAAWKQKQARRRMNTSNSKFVDPKSSRAFPVQLIEANSYIK
jgi:hypothetical protein